VCGCRIRRADGPPDYDGVLEPQQYPRKVRMAKPDYLQFFIDPNHCIGCQACRPARNATPVEANR
jgi:hypothetical protein